MNKVVYKCCICNEGIGEDAQKAHPFDPCAIILVGNWSKEREEQKAQQFFCHLECFRKLVEPLSSLYIEESDSND
jgi:hypothetical protein